MHGHRAREGKRAQDSLPHRYQHQHGVRLPTVAARLLVAAFTRLPPRSARSPPRLLRQSPAYRETIAGTTVSFEMVPCRRGRDARGRTHERRAVLHRPDRSDLGHVRRVRAGAGHDGGPRQPAADAVARPSSPYGAPGLRLGPRGISGDQRDARPAAEAFAKWLSQKTGRVYRLPTESGVAAGRHSGGWSGRTGRSRRRGRPGLASRQRRRAARIRSRRRRLMRLGLFDLFGNAAEWVTTTRRVARGAGRIVSRRARRRSAVPSRLVQDEGWNERDPQLPKSRWWLSDGPFVGFRLVNVRIPHEDMTDHRIPPVSRREFISTTAAAAAAFAWTGGVRVFGSDVIRLGLIGCGGRGTGAVGDCLRGTEGVELVALGDLAPDRLSSCRAELAKLGANAAIAVRIKVTRRHVLHRLRRVSEGARGAGVDLVILATPPAFRPKHLAAAVERRQAHLRGEARRGRRCRRAIGAGDLRSREGEEPRDWRRHAAAASGRLPADDQAHPRRRDRRRRVAARCSGTRAACGARDRQTDVDGRRVADSQLALLRLALRRSHRRTARAQSGCGELGAGRACR